MPLQWTEERGAPDETGAPSRVRVLSLWPYRSLTNRGFAWFIGITCALAALPMLTHLGSPVLWFLLPFFAATVGLTWVLLRRNWRTGDLVEELRLSPGQIRLDRRDPDGSCRDWEANPYWVRVAIHPKGPVENYLTLRGGPREVEIGAFLTPEERADLRPALERALDEARNPRLV